MKLTLQGDQIEVIREILESAVIELRLESARADSHDYRERLHDRERAVEGVLDQLGGMVHEDRAAL
jgi:hypothetical protein